MAPVLFPRFRHPAVLKNRLALLALLGLAAGAARAAAPVSSAASPVSAARPEVAGWKPLPIEVRREVDAFFMNMELAIDYNKLDLVMALYTPDAVEEMPDGGRFVFAGIRQRRQVEMDGYTKTVVRPATLQRNYLVYKPGATADVFMVKYPVREVGKSSGMTLAVDNIVYSFRRGAKGLQLSSMVVHASDGTTTPGKAPDLDGPTPTEIRLTNGVRLREVKVLQWSPDSLLIQYVGGTVPIRLVNIHPEDRAYFTANMDKALQAQKDEAMKAAQRNAAQSHLAEMQQQIYQVNTAQVEEMQAAHEAALDDAIGHHRLAVGMTTSQVRRSWGTPSRINQVDTEMGHAILWSYEGRGVDEHGAVIDAGVAFINDQVEILLNVRAKDKGLSNP